MGVVSLDDSGNKPICQNPDKIADKIADTFTLLTPYFVTVIHFCSLSLSFQPPRPQTMLCGNFCDLELQTNNIEWGSGVFSTVYCAIKRVVLFGTLKVLLKDNESTNYVADCSLLNTFAPAS